MPASMFSPGVYVCTRKCCGFFAREELYAQFQLLLRCVRIICYLLAVCVCVCACSAAFQCIIRVLYNLLVVQFAASISCRLSPDEQKAWLLKGQVAGCSKLESLLCRVIHLLTRSSLFEFDMSGSQRPAVCLQQPFNTEYRHRCLNFC